MPSLLHNAYGDAWGSERTTSRQLGSHLGTTIPETAEIFHDKTHVVETTMKPSVPKYMIHRETEYETSRGGDYVFNLSIKIDQQDCHLICLFIGVFIFSILFTKNKKLSPVSLL